MNAVNRILPAVVVAVLLCPAPAAAQWYAGTYVGANHNSPSDIATNEPSSHASLVFHDETFESQPFHWPLFWGARIGRLFHGKRFGIEVEELHLKVITRTDLPVHVTGTINGAAFETTVPMNLFVQRYNMTHGLNFLVANFVVRIPTAFRMSGRPATIVLRAGGGQTFSGTDTQVAAGLVEGYQRSGPGAQAAAGIDVPIGRGWSGIVDYKFTYARPTISLADGTGHMTAIASSIGFGLMLGFAR